TIFPSLLDTGCDPRGLISASSSPRSACVDALQRHLVLPETVEASRIHLCVPRGISDLTVPEIGSERAGVDTLIDELVDARVTQEMGRHPGHANAGGSPLEHLEKAVGGHRRFALGHKYILDPGS